VAVVAVILDTGERIRAGADDVRHSLPSLWDAVGAVRVRIPWLQPGEPLIGLLWDPPRVTGLTSELSLLIHAHSQLAGVRLRVSGARGPSPRKASARARGHRRHPPRRRPRPGASQASGEVPRSQSAVGQWNTSQGAACIGVCDLVWGCPDR